VGSCLGPGARCGRSRGLEGGMGPDGPGCGDGGGQRRFRGGRG